MDKKTTGYLTHLDFVRGLASLSVFWIHFCGAYGSPIARAVHHTPFSFLVDGKAAIAMFLLLSGIGCSFRFFRDGLRPMDAFKAKTVLLFYLSRFLRLTPPLFFAIGISYVTYRLFYTKYDTSPQISACFFGWWKDGHTLSLTSWIKQSLLLFPQTKLVLVPQTWVLGIIAYLYIFFPLVIAIARFSTRLSLLLVGIPIVFFDTGAYFFGFLLGVLIVKHLQQIRSFFENAFWMVRLLILFAGLFLFNIFHPMMDIPVPLSPNWQWTIAACGGALLVASFEGSQSVQRFFSFSAFRFLGKISYSLYLTHLIVLLVFTQMYLRAINSINITGATAYCSAFVVSTALAILLAWLCWKISEKPSQDLGKRLTSFFRETRH